MPSSLLIIAPDDFSHRGGHLYLKALQKDLYRREGKGRCCCSGGGAELIQFLASLDILHQDNLKKGPKRYEEYVELDQDQDNIKNRIIVGHNFR